MFHQLIQYLVSIAGPEVVAFYSVIAIWLGVFVTLISMMLGFGWFLNAISNQMKTK